MTLQDYIKLADGLTEDIYLSCGNSKATDSEIFYEHSRTLGPAMAKALIEAEEALLYVCARDVAKDVGDKAHKAIATIQALNGGVE